MNDEFNMESWITDLGKTRSDEYTERILAFVQEMEKSCPLSWLQRVQNFLPNGVHAVVIASELGNL